MVAFRYTDSQLILYTHTHKHTCAHAHTPIKHNLISAGFMSLGFSASGFSIRWNGQLNILPQSVFICCFCRVCVSVLATCSCYALFFIVCASVFVSFVSISLSFHSCNEPNECGLCGAIVSEAFKTVAKLPFHLFHVLFFGLVCCSGQARARIWGGKWASFSGISGINK